MKGIFLDVRSLDCNDLNLQKLCNTLSSWQLHEYCRDEHVTERLLDASIVVTNKAYIGDTQMASAPKLKLICISATGTNNVDLDAARRRSISVCNVPGYAAAAVSQHVFGLMLSLLGSLPRYHHAVQHGHWQQSRQFCLLDYPITEIDGKTLGIIGYGACGQRVAGIARAFGMKVLLAEGRNTHTENTSDYPRYPLIELLKKVDVLSIHCPLTKQTHGLIGENELALMKKSAILINTARGGIVDEAALASALRERRLRGAGIDVLESEPPSHGSPLLDSTLPNLIVTPHIAWASREARQRLVDEVTHNITAFLQGKPRNQLT